MDESNSFLVRYSLVRLDPGIAPSEQERKTIIDQT